MKNAYSKKMQQSISFKIFPSKFKKGRKGEIESKNLIQIYQLVNIDEKRQRQRLYK